MDLININLKISGRNLARTSGLALATVQGILRGKQTSTLATLERLAVALGYPKKSLLAHVRDFFATPPGSVPETSVAMMRLQDEWALPFFNFVDHLRATSDARLIKSPPVEHTAPRFKALIAATVETLCEEKRLDAPWWCSAPLILKLPWFVSGVENLKALALSESPLPFRRRNIFVLGNFLQRA